MQEKSDKDIIDNITIHLDKESTYSFGSTCQTLYFFSTSARQSHQLMTHVIYSNLNFVKQYLEHLKKTNENYWKIMFIDLPTTEISGRVWKKSSPFSYAIWSGNEFMVKIFLSHLPKEGLKQALSVMKQTLEDGEFGPPLSPVGKHIEWLEEQEKMFYKEGFEAAQKFHRRGRGINAYLPVTLLQYAKNCSKKQDFRLPPSDEDTFNPQFYEQPKKDWLKRYAWISLEIAFEELKNIIKIREDYFQGELLRLEEALEQNNLCDNNCI